jgi:hypothetical protein
MALLINYWWLLALPVAIFVLFVWPERQTLRSVFTFLLRLLGLIVIVVRLAANGARPALD